MHDSLTKHLESVSVPPLYAQENEKDATVFLRLLLLNSDWQWFVTELEQKDGDILFFGYVAGFDNEWGYFRLSDLRETGMLIYDCEFQPMRFSELKTKYGV